MPLLWWPTVATIARGRVGDLVVALESKDGDVDRWRPLVSSKPVWFVRRRIGFGVRPISWQGWVVSVIALGIVVATLIGRGRSTSSTASIVVVVGLYLAVGYARSESRTTSAVAKSVQSVDDAAPRSTRSPGESVARAVLANVAQRSLRETVQAAGSPANAIDVTKLTKRFGERTAFLDVTFSVARGEVFGFLGPNGAGKTTTVRTLSTLIEPTSGQARIAGIALEPQNGEAIRQKISVMTESPGLYAKLSVNENLEFFVGLYRLPNGAARIGDALEAVNLSARANDPCGSLSKGLRQRVGLARALLNDPEIIFLDEPTSGLDPVATREVSDLIVSLRSRGVTIFLTTHRLEEAERLCDRVAILNTTLRVVGRTDDLRQQLFSSSLEVVTSEPLLRPDDVFARVPAISSWRRDDAGHYVLETLSPKATAPAVARALVAANADIESLVESHHSLEDVYLQLIDQDAEVRP